MIGIVTRVAAALCVVALGFIGVTEMKSESSEPPHTQAVEASNKPYVLTAEDRHQIKHEAAIDAEIVQIAAAKKTDPTLIVRTDYAQPLVEEPIIPPLDGCPAGGTPSTNRVLGGCMAAQHGYDATQWACLDALASRESGWDHLRWNQAGSGAYGIPQSLPGSKMGAGWQTEPVVQVRWMLGYIASRYGTACNADAFQRTRNWY